jgi:molecular chaperone GrpE
LAGRSRDDAAAVADEVAADVLDEVRDESHDTVAPVGGGVDEQDQVEAQDQTGERDDWDERDEWDEPDELLGDPGAELSVDDGEIAFGVDEAEFVDGTVGRSDLAAERDEYLEALQRVKAEFDNYRKRVDKQRAEMVERAAEQLVLELLPVLDACDAAIAHGEQGVDAIASALFDTLGKQGLERMRAEGGTFDPALHEAVLHEDGEGDEHGQPVVAEVLRAGYIWKGRVLRPAMVKVQG